MSQTTTPNTAVGGVADFLDTRLGASRAIRGLARKLFPDHWSFLLGEMALYSFIVLLLSGTFLTLFFVPSMGMTTYEGAYAPLNNVPMSEAYASTLRLSFDIRGGLLMRQVHHWAALLFIASMTVHMFRVFFTGAFRKPREVNWIVGSVLALLGLGAGFSGYSLPDDLLSGNGLRIIDGVIKSIPVVGTYVSFFLFGGEFPGESIVPRLYIVHVLLIPGLILALIGVHLGLVFWQKHTQYPGPGRTDQNVVGYPLLPVYTAKAGGFFFVVFGVIAIFSAFVGINAVWNYGPYDPSPISAGTQPDWYILFIDGALRLMPGWEWTVAGFTISFNVLIPSLVIPGILTGVLIAWPFLESWATGDKREHHVLDRPRNAPVRTGAGVAAIVFYIALALAAANDLIATHLHMSINDLTWTLRFTSILGPPIAFWITKRICLGLQRRDRELALHGRETGRIVRTAGGEYFEVHEPLNEYDRWLLVAHEDRRPLELPPDVDENGVARPGARKDRIRQKISRWFYEDRIEPLTPSELAASHAEHEHALEAGEGEERPAVTTGR
ncbi:MAG TPA: cytochrome bc complex cytochrome b subunit [Actinomycetales bacterium]|nr:cytochrome bc complex cytochrome b subunit [Actinomycetales bacterium]